jgi:hypothetical protein
MTQQAMLWLLLAFTGLYNLFFQIVALLVSAGRAALVAWAPKELSSASFLTGISRHIASS